LATVDAGMSRRAAAGRLGVSVSSVIRWDAQRRATGSFEPKPQGDTRSRRIDARHADGKAAFEEARDGSIEEPRAGSRPPQGADGYRRGRSAPWGGEAGPSVAL
jgi:transposase